MGMEGFLIKNISKQYLCETGSSFKALDNISFSWRKNENISVIGESGSGKSTLARLLIGLEKPTTGKIMFDNENVSSWTYNEWKEKRKIIQGVFQDTTGTLNRSISVYNNLQEALLNLTSLTKKQIQERIYDLMEITKTSKRLLKIPTRQLSGGEQRRISLLRALSIRPAYLIMDEVTSGLDSISANEVLSVLENYHGKYNCTYLSITHDKNMAYRISDTIYEMKNGKLIRCAKKIN